MTKNEAVSKFMALEQENEGLRRLVEEAQTERDRLKERNMRAEDAMTASWQELARAHAEAIKQIDRLKGELAEARGRLEEALGHLALVTKYCREDKAVTPGFTRLDRLCVRIKSFLAADIAAKTQSQDCHAVEEGVSICPSHRLWDWLAEVDQRVMWLEGKGDRDEMRAGLAATLGPAAAATPAEQAQQCPSANCQRDNGPHAAHPYGEPGTAEQAQGETAPKCGRHGWVDCRADECEHAQVAELANRADALMFAVGHLVGGQYWLNVAAAPPPPEAAGPAVPFTGVCRVCHELVSDGREVHRECEAAGPGPLLVRHKFVGSALNRDICMCVLGCAKPKDDPIHAVLPIPEGRK